MPSACAGSGAAPSSSSTKSIASTKPSRTRFCPTSRRGDIVLIGATTENPSFEVNAALLSRSKVYMLRALTTEEIVALLRRALPVVGTHGFG